MTRHLCWLAVLAVGTLPDWASACWPRWAARHDYSHATYEPAYYPSYHVYPVEVPCCPPVCVSPPATGYPLAPPRVEAVPKAAPSNAGATRPRPPADPPSGVRPAAATEVAVPPSIPAAMPPRKDPPPAAVTEAAPPRKTAPPAAAVTDTLPLPKFPGVDTPKDDGALPKLVVPKDPDFTPIPVPVPKGPTSTPVPPAVPSPAPANPEAKPPAVEFPAPPSSSAVPSPAPPLPEGLIPSQAIPEIPEPGKPSALPSLTLPPDSPVAPQKSVSRSSPLAAERAGPTVSVFPAQSDRTALADGRKTVGFYNHTDRDVSLTIEGRAVNLPARTYLSAKLAPTFTWGHGTTPAVRATVPADASGLDVVFRD